jgi:hypothetical protein
VTEFQDAFRVKVAKSGETVTVYRLHIVAVTERTRTVKEKKPIERPNAA